jgi:hypothetical protein
MYLIELSFECKIFPTKVVQKIKIHAVCSITPHPHPQKSCSLWCTGNVEKYGMPRQTKDGNIIWSMRFTCCITKATETLRIYNILLLFHSKNGYANRLDTWLLNTGTKWGGGELHNSTQNKITGPTNCHSL